MASPAVRCASHKPAQTRRRRSEPCSCAAGSGAPDAHVLEAIVVSDAVDAQWGAIEAVKGRVVGEAGGEAGDAVARVANPMAAMGNMKSG